jgi:3-oxoacyl-[acyl-carrier protein] reductase
MVSPPKVALVTGAGRGLGRAIALRLAEDGAAVVVNYVASEKSANETVNEIKSKGGKAIAFQANVREFDAVKKMVAAGIDAFGPISILINNAGWMIPQAFEDNTEEYWDRVLDTKIKSSLYTVFSTLPEMKKLGWGKIINITGDSGRVGLARAVVHTGAQGALQSMTKSWAREFATYGIRVNAVSPGPIKSDQQEEFTRIAPDLASTDLWGPLGVGKPEDISAAVAFLVRNEGDHITGQILSVNGGRAYPS